MTTAHWRRGAAWPCPYSGCGAELHSVVILGLHWAEHQRDQRRQLTLDFGPEADLSFHQLDGARRSTRVPVRGIIQEPWKTPAGADTPANPGGGVFDGFFFSEAQA